MKSGSSLDVMCNLLESWGKCSTDLIDYMKSTNLHDLPSLQEKLSDALNPDILKDLLDAQKTKDSLEADSEDNSIEESKEEEHSQTSSLQFESIQEQHLEEEPMDLFREELKSKLQYLLEKNVWPFEEQQKSLREAGYERELETIQQTLKTCEGQVLLKEY